MTSGAETHDDETPETIYARALSIDAQCFAAAPPSTYVQHLTDEKIAVLRTSGITALFHGSLTLAWTSSLSPRTDVRFIQLHFIRTIDGPITTFGPARSTSSRR